jgi:hypothetical protein
VTTARKADPIRKITTKSGETRYRFGSAPRGSSASMVCTVVRSRDCAGLMSTSRPERSRSKVQGLGHRIGGCGSRTQDRTRQADATHG